MAFEPPVGCRKRVARLTSEQTCARFAPVAKLADAPTGSSVGIYQAPGVREGSLRLPNALCGSLGFAKGPYFDPAPGKIATPDRGFAGGIVAIQVPDLRRWA